MPEADYDSIARPYAAHVDGELPAWPTSTTGNSRMNAIEPVAHRLQDEELKLLAQLRVERRSRVRPSQAVPGLGARISDAVAALVGSWRFIIGGGLRQHPAHV